MAARSARRADAHAFVNDRSRRRTYRGRDCSPWPSAVAAKIYKRGAPNREHRSSLRPHRLAPPMQRTNFATWQWLGAPDICGSDLRGRRLGVDTMFSDLVT